MILNPMCQAMKRQGACTADGCADWGDCNIPRTSKMPPNVKVEIEMTANDLKMLLSGTGEGIGYVRGCFINVTLLESEGIDHCEVIEEEL